MSTQELSRTIDRIYEAAIIPEQWPGVFDAVAARTEAALGSLFVWRAGQVARWIGTPEAEQLIADYVALNRADFNSRAVRCAARDLGNFGFVTDLGMFTAQEIDLDPFYREFLYPRGYGWVAATTITAPSGDQYFYSWERSRARGPFEKSCTRELGLLRPHLARAALLASQLDFQRAAAMTGALAAVGLPAAVLRAGGRLYAANALFEKLIPDAFNDRRERLTLSHAKADSLFAQALSKSTRTTSTKSVQSIPIPGNAERMPMILHVLPVRGAAHDIFSAMESITVVTPVDRRTVPSAEVLQGLFDLTPAEARVACSIGRGRSIEEIATAGGLSRETIRAQLKAVLAKTGLNRQTELIALLGGAAISESTI